MGVPDRITHSSKPLGPSRLKARVPLKTQILPAIQLPVQGTPGGGRQGVMINARRHFLSCFEALKCKFHSLTVSKKSVTSWATIG